MFGTVARVSVKPDRWDDLLAIYDEWDRETKPNTPGAIAGYLYRLESDPNAAIMCVVFEDKTSYFANANDPATDKWYERFRECLSADPEWMDGTIVRGG